MPVDELAYRIRAVRALELEGRIRMITAIQLATYETKEGAEICQKAIEDMADERADLLFTERVGRVAKAETALSVIEKIEQKQKREFDAIVKKSGRVPTAEELSRLMGISEGQAKSLVARFGR